MEKKIFFVFLLFVIFSTSIYSKGNDDGKDNGVNTNKPTDQMQNRNERQEKKKDGMAEKDNTIIKQEKTIKKRDLMKYCISISVESEKLTNSINKEIKKSNGELSNINSMQIKLNGRINEIYRQSEVFFNDIDEREKKDIKEQLIEIEKITSKLTFLISEFDVELKKEKMNYGTLSNKNRAIEKEIKKLSRQYRAVEWILFDSK